MGKPMKKNHNKSFATLALIALTLISLPAHAGFMDNLLGINSPERLLKKYKAIEDKPLVGNFYMLSQDGKTEEIADDLKKAGFRLSGIEESEIAFVKTHGNAPNMGEAARSLDGYISNADSDEIAKKYIAIALGRGNSVSIFQPKLGDGMCLHFGVAGFIDGQQRATFCGHDRVLIEYDKTGRVVSFVNRVFQATTFIGITMNQYTAIYSGEQIIRHLEDSISQREIDKYFIREIRPSLTQPASQPTPQPKEDGFGRDTATPTEHNL